jgi:hypothetical protein
MKRFILPFAVSMLFASNASALDWRHEVLVDEFTDKQTHIASASWKYERNSMMTMFICRDMNPVIAINTDDYQGRGNASIMYRVGEREPVSKEAPLSADGKTVYFREKQDVWSMSLGLLEGRLLFSVSDFNGSRTRTSIPVGGAESALRQTPCMNEFFVWYDAKQAAEAAKKKAAEDAAKRASTVAPSEGSGR